MSQRRLLIVVLGAAALTAMFYALTKQHEVDTLFVNGNVFTVDKEFRVVTAFAVNDGKIVSTGSDDEIKRRYVSAATVDLGGKTVFPGLIDAHAHLTDLGEAAMSVDLVGSGSARDCADRVSNVLGSIAEGAWVKGRGWDQNIWGTRGFPTARTLDAVSSSRPIILERIDGHAVWVNTRAMQLAGVNAQTADPQGGRIVRDQQGQPTGVFVDNAIQLITSRIPEPDEAELQQRLTLAVEKCLSLGLTGVHDMGADMARIQAMKSLIGQGKFPLRVYVAVGGEGSTWDAFRASGPLIGFGNDHLTVRSIKLYADGALGSRGAALIEPYDDDPSNRGLTLTETAVLSRVVGEALEAGFQVCTHAIGDRGNNIILNVYESMLRAHPGTDRRLRIEHAQVIDGADIPRFAKLGVIPSMQPTHCTSDMYWAEARLGPDRVRNAYAWRSLLKTGVIIPGGSDFPVERPDPLEGLYAAITRRDRQGRPANAADVRRTYQLSKKSVVADSDFVDGWYGEQRMTYEEALRSFTIWAATAAFEEEVKGSLEPGKVADFIVLDRTISFLHPETLLNASVEGTYVDGKRVYSGEPH